MDSYFSLDTNLIPTLRSYGIRFRFINTLHDPTKIMVMYSDPGVTCDKDICQVEAIQDLSTSYCYKVTWVNSRDIICFPIKYKHYTVLIADIKKVIERLKNDRIKEAIENIGKAKIYEKRELTNDDIVDTNESCYLVSGRGNGKMYNWRNEYQKERDKFDIKDIIFNNPATIVLWADGTKTVVKAENEKFDPEKGLAMAIAKKALGNNYGYYDTFKKYVGKYEKKQKKGDK